ncbi:site-specific integrase [Erythrobacter sp. SD-21]|uniref:tyrosine-type recombinase/integrase n=1 Tax=Erythrobacter sp. SD-21 TaxID=161528 RepID=UPI000153F5E8|nr:site-specific integrase [Erythrobacter sp. SD-21]EDL48035.1 phage integrase [Erythrobacter sp. SD-21]
MKNQKGEAVKDTTVIRDLAHLRAAIRYASKCNFSAPQIDWSAAIKNKAEKHRTRTLSDAEQVKLFAAIEKLHPDLDGPVRFAILSAARKTAVFNLTWDDVDFEENVAFIHLKGEGDRPIVHEIPLTKAMVELLQAQPKVENCNRVFTYKCRKSSRATNHRKGERYPWTQHGIYKPWNAVVKEAGLRDFRFHDLQHTGATRLVRAVPNLELARQLLGHADIKTTQKYANTNWEDVRAAMELVSEPRIAVIEGGQSG